MSSFLFFFLSGISANTLFFGLLRYKDDHELNSDKPKIKAVTLDLWETLLLEWDGANKQRILIRCRNLARALSKFGVQTSVDQLASALKAMTPWLLSVWEKNREVTHLDQIRFIVEAATDGSVSLREEWFEELSSAYVSAIFELPPRLNPDAPQLLRWLKGHGKRVGLICNVGRTPGFILRKFLEDVEIAKFFDVMIFSDEVGTRKPHPKIFHIAAKRLGVKPFEIVHIGDNLRSDVWGAKNAGFKAIHFSTRKGRDMIAESDPNSLVSISRRLGDLKEEEIVPDRTVNSLAMAIAAIKELEK